MTEEHPTNPSGPDPRQITEAEQISSEELDRLLAEAAALASDISEQVGLMEPDVELNPESRLIEETSEPSGNVDEWMASLDRALAETEVEVSGQGKDEGKEGIGPAVSAERQVPGPGTADFIADSEPGAPSASTPIPDSVGEQTPQVASSEDGASELIGSEPECVKSTPNLSVPDFMAEFTMPESPGGSPRPEGGAAEDQSPNRGDARDVAPRSSTGPAAGLGAFAGGSSKSTPPVPSPEVLPTSVANSKPMGGPAPIPDFMAEFTLPEDSQASSVGEEEKVVSTPAAAAGKRRDDVGSRTAPEAIKDSAGSKPTAPGVVGTPIKPLPKNNEPSTIEKEAADDEEVERADERHPFVIKPMRVRWQKFIQLASDATWLVADRGVAVLDVLDRPFGRVGRGVRHFAGLLAVATLGTAMIVHLVLRF